MNKINNADSINPSAVYSVMQKRIVSDHIEKRFGRISETHREYVSPFVHIDIAVIPPDIHRNFYTLVTIGCGALRMKGPKELKKNKLDRFELLMMLPPDWKINNREEKWFWPFHVLRSVGRIPAIYDSWLCFGHTVDNGDPFAGNTKLCATLLTLPYQDYFTTANGSISVCPLSEKEDVNFYNVTPIYRDEALFIKEYGSGKFMERFRFIPPVLDIKRGHVCGLSCKYDFSDVIDSTLTHAPKIHDKLLRIPVESAANHIVIFILWCIKHNMLDDGFFASCDDPERLSHDLTYLRDYFINSLDGMFLTSHLTEEAFGFVLYYYNFNEDRYPSDVDRCANEFFGDRKYNSPEFCNEGYLFAPFDAEYAARIFGYIDKAYESYTSL